MLLAWLLLTTAAASEPATWHGEVDDVPVWITVVPRGHEIERARIDAEPWWRWGNTTTDAYLFASVRPENVHLVLTFDQEADGTPVARMFTSRTPIRHRVGAEDLGLTIHPAFTTKAHGGSWVINGETNYDLSIWQDGLGPNHPFVTNRLVAPEPDGRFDAFVRVGGEPGLPEWQTWRLLHDPRPGWSLTRFDARLRMDDAHPFRTVEPFMPSFPYLGVRTSGVDWLAVNPPPFSFDPLERTLTFNAIPGFQNAGMYWVNSTTFPPDVGFESPFAFYGFDADSRRSHLVVRAQNSSGPERGLAGRHRTTFRYAWKVDEMVWKYAFFVAGFHEYDDVLVLGEERFEAIPPERLPEWVAHREWPVVTFVETMDESLASARGSEGIYFYNVSQSNAIVPWLGGVSERVPVDLTAPLLPEEDVLERFSELGIPVGYRGQYSASYFRLPEIAFSDIDRTFHLLHGAGGVWNLGEGRILRYHNIAGGALMDGWTRERLARSNELESRFAAGDGPPFPRATETTVEEAVYAFDGHLLYAGADRIVVLELLEEPASFRVDTPTDRASWTTFRDLHRLHAVEPRDPADLSTWLEAFAGERATLEDATLHDYRIDAGGVRFEIVVGAVGEGEERIASSLDVLRGLEPGRHVVRYDVATRTWTLEEARPVDLGVDLAVHDEPPRAFAPARVTVVLENRSNRDAAGPLSLGIGGFEHTSEALLVPASGRIEHELIWIPRREGEVGVRLEFGGLTYDVGPIRVEKRVRDSGVASLALSPRGASPGFIVLLGVFVILTIVALSLAWRRL